MNVTLNGKKLEIEKSPISLAELLVSENVPNADMVSVQINGKFVEKNEFSKKIIESNDEIDFLYFMGGGCFLLY